MKEQAEVPSPAPKDLTTTAAPLSFREGERLRISGGAKRDTFELLTLVLRASLALGGKPVICSELLPGVSLWLTVGTLQANDAAEIARVAEDIWSAVRSSLIDWLRLSPIRPGIAMELKGGTRLEFVWTGIRPLRPGHLQIDVAHDKSFVVRYTKHRKRHPLVESAEPVEDSILQSFTVLRRSLLDAIEKSIQTNQAKYARLPAPVRYRLTGALSAWRNFHQQVDATLADLSISAALVHAPIKRVITSLNRMTLTLHPDGAATHSANELSLHASHSAVWQAFDARAGIFYEPSAALHRLLDSTYIADNVPIGVVQLPTDTLCIIPEPSRWKTGGYESIVLFKQAHSLCFVTWAHRPDTERSVVMDVLTLSTEESDRTIRDLLDEAFQTPQSGDDQIRQHWRNSLDYAIKMLLYMAVRDAHVTRDLARTQAAKSLPSGLGRRKREAYQVQVDHLYDRHIVGPAILDEEPETKTTACGGREVSSHWRRPYFKMQHYGPGAALRKVVFFGPAIVRADRL